MASEEANIALNRPIQKEIISLQRNLPIEKIVDYLIIGIVLSIVLKGFGHTFLITRFAHKGILSV
jgi:ABC-type microcin C transport system duplicated ATPase subunit YejF